MTRKCSQIISWFLSKFKFVQIKMNIKFLENMLHSHSKMVKFLQFDALIQEWCQLEIHSYTISKISASCSQWHHPAVCTRPLNRCNLPLQKTLDYTISFLAYIWCVVTRLVFIFNLIFFHNYFELKKKFFCSFETRKGFSQLFWNML